MQHPTDREYSFDEFNRGMMGSVDPRQMPKGAGQFASNVDSRRMPGKMCKPPGVGVFDFNELWPPVGYEGCRIISVGHSIYTRIWHNAENVNDLREVLVVQVENLPDGDHGFDYFLLGHTVGTDDWIIEGPFWCGWEYDPVSGEYNPTYEGFAGRWGVTKPGRIRWAAHGGILRGGCGSFIETDPDHPYYNKSNSFPVSFVPVYRYPIDPDDGDVEGFFQQYNPSLPNLGHCRHGYVGLFPSLAMPDYPSSWNDQKTYQLEFDGSGLWKVGSVMGFSKNYKLIYAVVPVFDGHQTSPLKAEPIGMSHYMPEDPECIECWTTRLKLKVYDSLEEQSFPARLSGFEIYRSITEIASGEEVPALSSYNLIATADIKDGIEKVYIDNAHVTDQGGDEWDLKYYVQKCNTTPTIGLFSGLYVKIYFDDGTTEEHRIISSFAGDLGNFYYNYHLRISVAGISSNLVDGEDYYTEINSRWDFEPIDTMYLKFVDLLTAIRSAPPWIKVDKKLEDQPKVLSNYGVHGFHKDYHFIMDVAYEDRKRRNMIRWNNAPLMPYPGADLFSNERLLPTTDDDTPLGVMDRLDYMLIVTEKGKIFKAMMTSAGLHIYEDHWDLGIVSADSLVEIDGNFYLVGRKGNLVSLIFLNPPADPVDFGAANRKLIEEIIALPNMELDRAYGFYLPEEDKYLISFPQCVQPYQPEG